MPRKIWVSTIAMHRNGGPTVDDNLRRAGRLVEMAAQDRPDIICLPETFPFLGVASSDPADVAEPVPGPITEIAAGWARKHETNLICPIKEKRDDLYYNVAVVIDRKGQIVGTYDKLHPVTSSHDFTQFESGITPGREPQVFDLDIGRIGVLICFDSNWPADWARLAEMGAEIVFWPSAYDGGFKLRAYAWLHHYYVVSACLSSHARIVDITGEVLAESGMRTSVIEAEIDLEKKYMHTDFNASQIPAMKAKYGRDVEIRIYNKEAGMTVTSNRPGLSVDDLRAEFDLEEIPEYARRHDVAEKDTREGRKPEPQTPRRTPAQHTTYTV